MFSSREAIQQYGTPQGVKRDFGALATSGPAPKRINTVPGWNWSLDQPARSNAPGANALHSINVQLVDQTGYDAETLYGHPIFSVRAKEARVATAYTLDGLNEYLLAASQEFQGPDLVRRVLKAHEVRFAGFFAHFTNDAAYSNGARTFALVVGGLHEVRVPLAENLETNRFLQLCFEAKAAVGKEVQTALAARGRGPSVSLPAAGSTVYVHARFSSAPEVRDTTFHAGHLAHVRMRYTKPGVTDVTAACAGPRSAYVHGMGLHVLPSLPRTQLYQ